MFSLSVYNLLGEEVTKIDLDEEIFNGKVNISLLHQVINMYQANKRQGTASTKTRANVSGGNSKPWRQKGTGRARVGSSRSPIWRKGGIVFGPHPRDYSYKMPKKMKRLAFISSLNARLNEQQVKILDELKVDSGKTKEFVQILNTLNLKRKILFVYDQLEATSFMAARNIKHVNLKKWQIINALDVLSYDNFVITKAALGQLISRLKKEEK
ncbi:MAG: 50S ribosomal protein L4 [Candidatus Omnitrophota bacterium]|nr:MAG: 50S ribosomal protein L4 [Candidatus Omnitrophota bacterium]